MVYQLLIPQFCSFGMYVCIYHSYNKYLLGICVYYGLSHQSLIHWVEKININRQTDTFVINISKDALRGGMSTLH